MNAGSGQLPRLDVVIGNNFGHLPMFVGAEKGIFKNHGIDAHMKVVDTGTDMVNAMHNGEAQIGDMSVTTFLKAVHSGEPFKVIGIIMNDATRDNADEPLGIVTRKGTGINAGNVADLKGKRIDRKTTRLYSSHQITSYPLFCFKKNNPNPATHHRTT